MAANIGAIRDGIKTRLATISGLRAYDTVPDTIAIPAAVVGAPELIDFNAVMGGSKNRYTIPVRIFASRASDRSGQDKIDAYLAAAGASSVRAAIQGDQTLAGIVDYCVVDQARNYGVFDVAGVEYFGVELVCTILG